MIKRIFLVTSILVFLFIACHKEQDLPPVVKKSLNYGNELKPPGPLDLTNFGLECIGFHGELFSDENELSFFPLYPPACYTPYPTDLYYILIDINGSDVSFKLHFYNDLDQVITSGEVAYNIVFSFKEVGTTGFPLVSTTDSPIVNITLFQEYIIYCNVTFTDFECVYEKNAEFSIKRGLAFGSESSPWKINVVDNTSLIGQPFPPNPCGAGLSAVAIIVP